MVSEASIFLRVILLLSSFYIYYVHINATLNIKFTLGV